MTSIYHYQRPYHHSATDLPLALPSPTYPAVQYTRRPTKAPGPSAPRAPVRPAPPNGGVLGISFRTPWWKKLLALPASLHAGAPRQHSNELYDSRAAAELEALVVNTLTARGAPQTQVFGLADAIATALLMATLDPGAAEALWLNLFHGDARAHTGCAWCVEMRRRVPTWIADAVDAIDAQRHAGATLQLRRGEDGPVLRPRRAVSDAQRPHSVRVPVPPLIPPPIRHHAHLSACLESPGSDATAHSDDEGQLTAVEWMSEDDGVVRSATKGVFASAQARGSLDTTRRKAP
ncbi:hypothetical protein Q8F55_006382 [Vanrija albida]|uniref:Uncharacterized protein n=1 Tax=Vanrija albida TaxID=181172 RepID=A0ABR3PWZ9_9TREE